MEDAASIVKRGLSGPLLAPFSVNKAHLSCRFSPHAWSSMARSWRRSRRRPQFRDHAQNVGEEISGNGHLHHLERDVASVTYDLRADPSHLRTRNDTSSVGCRIRQFER